MKKAECTVRIGIPSMNNDSRKHQPLHDWRKPDRCAVITTSTVRLSRKNSSHLVKPSTIFNTFYCFEVRKVECPAETNRQGATGETKTRTMSTHLPTLQSPTGSFWPKTITFELVGPSKLRLFYVPEAQNKAEWNWRGIAMGSIVTYNSRLTTRSSWQKRWPLLFKSRHLRSRRRFVG